MSKLIIGDLLFYRKNNSAITTTRVVDVKGNFAELQNGDVACVEPLHEKKNKSIEYKGGTSIYQKVYE